MNNSIIAALKRNRLLIGKKYLYKRLKNEVASQWISVPITINKYSVSSIHF
jgi:hypothetical protein